MLIDEPYDLSRDDEGDLLFVNGLLVFTTGYDAVKQAIDICINMFLGEWFLNLEEGVAWFTILGRRYNPVTVAGEMRKAILKVPMVSNIAELSSSLDAATRTLTIDWTVVAVFGDTVSGTTTVGAA